MINLLPRDGVFFDLFDGLSGSAVTAAENLRRLVSEFPNVTAVIQTIRQGEREADEFAHKALARLDRTFITPFDREDMHTLVEGLDDIVDDIDALAKRFTLYHVTHLEPLFGEQADVLVAATKAVDAAVRRLRRSRKLAELSDQMIEIHRLENVGDENNHAAVSRLFEGNTDALEVMKWKELFDRIERAIDRCEDVSNTLERIVLKNG
jgi:predicted phosphate transport protein (TIGR00153 family)